MKKMKVIVVSDVAPPWSVGGAERRIEQLREGLRKFEVDFEIATMKWDEKNSSSYTFISPYLSIYKNGRRSILSSVVFSLCTLRLITAKVDLIEVNQFPILPIFPAWLIAKIKGVPLTATWHESWTLNDWSAYSPKYGYLMHQITRLSLKLPNKIVAASELTYRELLNSGIRPNRVEIVENEIDLGPDFVDDISNFGFDFLYVGRLIKHKNVDLVIRAWAQLSATRSRVSLGIIGAGPELESLKNLAESLGVGHSVSFLGHIESRAELMNLFRHSKIFVSASSREGYGIAVAEAIALGLWTIVSDSPSNASKALISSITGRVFKDGDENELHQAMAGALEDTVKPLPHLVPKLESQLAQGYMDIWTELVTS